MAMQTADISDSLTTLLSELTDGAKAGGAYVLNTGDVGLLRSLDKLSAADASQSLAGGATIAAHAEHLRFGLSLMNRWAREGGNPFADAAWDKAWQTTVVDDAEWTRIRNGLRDEATGWLRAVGSLRDVNAVELNGVIGSIAHLGYHLGAMRQIAAGARGPREGTFK
jgi:hypothetical protein